VHPCAADLFFMLSSPVIPELRLREAGLALAFADPAYAYLDPDGPSIAFWRDPQRTAEEIRRFSHRDAAAYLELARALDVGLRTLLPFLAVNPIRPPAGVMAEMAGVAWRHRRRLPAAVAVLARPAVGTLGGFEHPIVRDALAALIGAGGSLTERGSGAGFLFLGFLHRYGVARPIGGMQTLIDALVHRLRCSGGEVKAGVKVEEIIVRGGRAVGVRLEGGQQIEARRAVVAACHPVTALDRLLPAGTLPERLVRRIRRIPSNGDGTGDLKVDMALAGQVNLLRHAKWRRDALDLRVPATMVGGIEAINTARAAARAGELPGSLSLWAFFPAAVDPGQAPPGAESVYLWSPFVPARPAEALDQFRKQASTALLNHATLFYDGLDTGVVASRVTVSQDFAQRYSVPAGCILHVDLTARTAGPLRPARGLAGYATPINGLYLASTGTHPGVAVSGYSGRNAAKELLRRR
jgi:phytoene dehydrogenase-like protein